MKLNRIKVITGYAAHARFLAECEDEEFLIHPVGTIPRQSQIPSPYRYSPTHDVLGWNGRKVVIVETRHRRYEVFEVIDGTIDPWEEGSL